MRGEMNQAVAETSVREYALSVLEPRLKRMLAHAEGVLSGEDIEAVHQMRVWSRRTRAALEMFHACFSGKAYEELEQEVKSVTRALGAARDLDVMIDALDKQEAALPPDQRAGLESFLEKLRRQRREQQKSVAKAIARLEKRNLAQNLETLKSET